MASFNEVVLGLLMMALTVLIHSTFMALGEKALKWRIHRYGYPGNEFAKARLLAVMTAWMFLAIFTEAWLWSLMYVYHPLITTLPDIETALYFSMVTFTTVGYGDVVLTGQWRILASIQAANGVIIFGWTTALIFAWIQMIFLGESASKRP